jgi:hypothetical protein
MASYRLDQLEGGVTAIGPSRWRWYVMRLNSLPSGQCELQHLIFVSETDGGGIMRARVPSDVDVVDDRAVLRHAMHPDDRSFRGRRGWLTVYPPNEEDTEPMWRVRPEARRPFRTDIAIEKSLGELSNDDLLAIESVG